ncbi:MAG TPA: IPT/TIG domain-containing protein, partial [Acidimicrobiia bacterium]
MAVALVVGMLVAQTGPAGAVNSGGGADAVAIDLTTFATSVGGVPVVPGVSGTLSSSTAPTSTYGTATGSVVALAIVPVLTTTAVSSASTRGPSGTAANAGAAGVAASLLGRSVVSASAVSSSVQCPTGGTSGVPTTSAQVSGLSVLGNTVDVSAGAVTLSAPVDLGIPGVSDATLTVTVSQPTSHDASSAAVIALRVSARLTVHGFALPTVDTIVLRLDIARSTCGVPTAATPTVTSLDVVTGLVSGGESVTITGSDLVPGATAVTFGSTPATVTSVSADGTQAVAIAPAHGAGPVDVTVTTPGGSTTLASGFTYVLPPPVVPTIVGLDVSSGP